MGVPTQFIKNCVHQLNRTWGVPAQLIKKCIHQQNEKTRPKMRGENIPFRGPKGAEICMREAV